MTIDIDLLNANFALLKNMGYDFHIFHNMLNLSDLNTTKIILLDYMICIKKK